MTIKDILKGNYDIPKQCENCKNLKFCFDHLCMKHKTCNERIENVETEYEVREE